MPTLRLKHVNPLGDVEYPVLGRTGDNYVRAGEELDVDTTIAGEAPGTWREPTDAERAEHFAGLLTREAGEPGDIRVEVLSPGSGLLATRNFELVKASAKSGGKTTPQEA